VVAIPVSQVIAGSLFPYAVGQWFSFTTASSPIPVYTFEIANMYIVSVPLGPRPHYYGGRIDGELHRCEIQAINRFSLYLQVEYLSDFCIDGLNTDSGLSTTTVRHFMRHDQVAIEELSGPYSW
jgi:hypothetical protein